MMHRAAESGRLQGDMLSEDQCRRSLSRMANAIELFCTGQAGEIFNRPGTTWPESDVTVVELGALAHRRNEAWLAVAMSGLLSRINDQVQSPAIFDAADRGSHGRSAPATQESLNFSLHPVRFLQCGVHMALGYGLPLKACDRFQKLRANF